MWLPVFVLLALAALSAPPVLRAHRVCVEGAAANEALARSPQCADPHLRARFGPKQWEACEAARAERHLSPWVCAVERAWTGGSVYGVWVQAAESHWLLFGLGAVLIWATAWGLLGAWSRRADHALLDRIFAHREPQPPEGLQLVRRPQRRFIN